MGKSFTPRSAKFLLLTLLQLVGLVTYAQVHVRGYYRSNGTYVQPHQRTSPNHTVTDNYSYPGNYNPNTGRVTGGTYYTGYTGSPTTSRASTYNSTPSSASSNNSTPRSGNTSKANVLTVQPGVYGFNTPMEVPLRVSPRIDAMEAYTCPSYATVIVIEDTNERYCQVSVNGHVGYVSKGLLIKESATAK
jgi:hypothetical protein